MLHTQYNTHLIFSVFTELRKATTSFIIFLCLTMKNLAPTGQIFIKFMCEYFSKICHEESTFIKIWQESCVLYMKTNWHIWSHLTQFFWESQIFLTKVTEKIKTHIVCSITLSQILCHLGDNVGLWYSQTHHKWEYNTVNVLCMMDN